jgi:predicted nucleotide-binding protein with TIR-like domain
MAEQSSEPSILERLRRAQQHPMLMRANRTREILRAWVTLVRRDLKKIYGNNTQFLAAFPMVPNTLSDAAIPATLTQRLEQLNRIIKGLETSVTNSVSPLLGNRIFIGHGRSLLWRELKDFIADRLKLPWEEFNREAVAGISTSERLEDMLAHTAFAFLIMTAEEEHSDAQLYARPNVIHEVGLFQGRLGQRRAIVMVEEGCAEFSNIIGLSQIRFPRGHISASFEDVRRVLEREKLI